ncbi:MAG TPA: NTP transferase domain-containing protein [Devosia sp.]|uniref:molybdenum cofactor guanylyltransferase n=1 Tax=Devosia sp. TaxID=1871048 RepID=UPI002F938E66
MSLPHIVILAGGQGQRLGHVRKADLRIGGRTLLGRVADALGPSGVKMLALGPVFAYPPAPTGFLAVRDLDTSLAGPLAGLAGAIAALQGMKIEKGLLVSVAVDTPFLPHNFVSRLQAGLHATDAAYASWRDQPYPTNAIWRIEAVADLPRQVHEGTAPPSLRRLLEQMDAAAVDWSAEADMDPFANVNTVADLLTLARRLIGAPPSPVIHKRGN